MKILSSILQNDRKHFDEHKDAKYEKEYFSILADLKLKDSVD